jgi:2,3-dihydroxybiphenyl 1,2-dioxygenase
MEVSERAPDGTVYLRMDEYHHRVALHPSGDDDMIYAGWGVPNETEFEAMKQRMADGGIEFSQGSQADIANRMVRDMVKFNVSGVPYELFYGLKVLFEKPFVGGRPMQGFKTGDLGMGHIGFPLRDVQEINEATRVFRDVLGFKMSDWIGDTPFFHVNPREHALTFPPRRPGTPNKLIGHFMLEVNSLDDVGTAFDMCVERGMTINSTIGKHTNDHMVSFYVQTPSGFGLEYGWGGRLIDDETWQVNTYDSANIWGHRRGLLIVNTNDPEQVRSAIEKLQELAVAPA